jgi:hypothetical protein
VRHRYRSVGVRDRQRLHLAADRSASVAYRRLAWDIATSRRSGPGAVDGYALAVGDSATCWRAVGIDTDVIVAIIDRT